MNTVFPKTNWLKALPEDRGMDSMGILKMLSCLRDAGTDIHSLLIVKDGYTVFEHYFPPYDDTTPHQIYSCSKTFTCMLIGIAQSKGLLSLDDRVMDFFPEEASGLQDENLKKMKIRHLLTMSSGHRAEGSPKTVDGKRLPWVQSFLRTPVEFLPGSRYFYENSATFMLSAILTKVTDVKALELLYSWIFDEIGVKSATWCEVDGYTRGCDGMMITPRDMARFGLLLLNGGKWDSKQIIPEKFVNEASTRHSGSVTPELGEYRFEYQQGYCYQAWRYSFNGWRADGMGGQQIGILPDQNTVIVATSAIDNTRKNILADNIRDALLPAMGDVPLPPSPETAEQISAFLASYTDEIPPENAGDLLPPDKTYHFEPSDTPLKISSLRVGGDYAEIDWVYGKMTLPWSWNAAKISGISKPALTGTPLLPVASSMVLRGGSAVLRIHIVGDPNTTELVLMPRSDGLDISAVNTLWWGKSPITIKSF